MPTEDELSLPLSFCRYVQFFNHFPDPLQRGTAVSATSSVIDFNAYSFRFHSAQDNDNLFLLTHEYKTIHESQEIGKGHFTSKATE